MKILRWSLLSLLFLSLPFWARAEEMGEKTTVVVEGVAPLTNKPDRARDIALTDAWRRAIEKAMGALVSSETLVENYKVLKDRILTKSSGYISSYTILNETMSGGLYHLQIRATVALKNLKDDLAAIGLLFEVKHKPRVMIVIPETHLGRPKIPDPAAETEMIRLFTEKGFEVVDQSQIKKIRYNDRVKAAVAGDIGAATQLALEYGAEVIIVGEAFSQFNSQLGGLVSTRARVESRAVLTDTAKILAANAFHGAGVDTTEELSGKLALANAGGQVANYFIDQILKRWAKEASGKTMVQVVAKVRSYEQLKEFKNGLKQIRTVKNIHQRSYTSYRAVIDVDVELGGGQELADDISGMRLASGKVEITYFTAHRIDVEIK